MSQWEDALKSTQAQPEAVAPTPAPKSEQVAPPTPEPQPVPETPPTPAPSAIPGVAAATPAPPPAAQEEVTPEVPTAPAPAPATAPVQAQEPISQWQQALNAAAVTPSDTTDKSWLDEAGQSAIRGAGTFARMPKQILSVFGVKTDTTEGMAQAGEELEAAHPASASVSGSLADTPSMIVNPQWWAATLPGLVVTVAPLLIAGLLGGAEAGTAATIAKGVQIVGGGAMGLTDAAQRMLDYDRENPGKEIPILKRVTIGLGAMVAGAMLPGATMGKIMGPIERNAAGEIISKGFVPLEQAIDKVWAGASGTYLGQKAIAATMSGGSMAGFSVVENAFEKYGYNPDKKITQGVLESLVLGAAMGGLEHEIGRLKDAPAKKAAAERLQKIMDDAVAVAKGTQGQGGYYDNMKGPEEVAQPEPTVDPSHWNYQTKTPEVVKPQEAVPVETPKEDLQRAIFGSTTDGGTAVGDLMAQDIPNSDKLTQLRKIVGSTDRAEQFFELYRRGDYRTALKEFPELANKDQRTFGRTEEGGNALGDIVQGGKPEQVAVRELATKLGDIDKAQRFYDLWKAGAVDTAYTEFHEEIGVASGKQEVPAQSVGPNNEPPAGPVPMVGPGEQSVPEHDALIQGEKTAPTALPDTPIMPTGEYGLDAAHPETGVGKQDADIAQLQETIRKIGENAADKTDLQDAMKGQQPEGMTRLEYLGLRQQARAEVERRLQNGEEVDPDVLRRFADLADKYGETPAIIGNEPDKPPPSPLQAVNDRLAEIDEQSQALKDLGRTGTPEAIALNAERVAAVESINQYLKEAGGDIPVAQLSERTDPKTGALLPYDPAKINSMDVAAARQRGLITNEQAAVYDSLIQAFPKYAEYFQVMISDQRFAPTKEMTGAAGLGQSPKMVAGYEVAGTLQDVPYGEDLRDSKHLAVIFVNSGGDMRTVIHEFGEFIWRRIITGKRYPEGKVVMAAFKEEVANGTIKAGMFANEYFSQRFTDWWLSRDPNYNPRPEMRNIFQRTLQFIKDVYAKLASRQDIPTQLRAMFEDIVINQKDIRTKEYRYNVADMVGQYLLGSKPTEEQIKGQGLVKNLKTGWSYDPGGICPKQQAFIGWLKDYIAAGDVPLVKFMDIGYLESLWKMPQAEGVDVPCSYCYVKDAQRKAIQLWNESGGKTTMVNFSMAKILFGEVPYTDMILTKAKKNPGWVDEVNKRGGLRIFAFADYVRELHRAKIDLVLRHAEQVGLSVKVITKNPEFVEDFGDTGIRINLSIDNLMRDANGNLIRIADSKVKEHGIDWDVAWKLKNDPRYPGVKIRCVALNPPEFRWWLGLEREGQPFVDVVTPFHYDGKGTPPNGFVDMHSGEGHKQFMAIKEELDPLSLRTCCQKFGKCYADADFIWSKTKKGGVERDTIHDSACATNCGGGEGTLTIPQNSNVVNALGAKLRLMRPELTGGENAEVTTNPDQGQLARWEQLPLLTSPTDGGRYIDDIRQATALRPGSGAGEVWANARYSESLANSDLTLRLHNRLRDMGYHDLHILPVEGLAEQSLAGGIMRVNGQERLMINGDIPHDVLQRVIDHEVFHKRSKTDKSAIALRDAVDPLSPVTRLIGQAINAERERNGFQPLVRASEIAEEIAADWSAGVKYMSPGGQELRLIDAFKNPKEAERLLSKYRSSEPTATEAQLTTLDAKQAGQRGEVNEQLRMANPQGADLEKLQAGKAGGEFADTKEQAFDEALATLKKRWPTAQGDLIQPLEAGAFATKAEAMDAALAAIERRWPVSMSMFDHPVKEGEYRTAGEAFDAAIGLIEQRWPASMGDFDFKWKMAGDGLTGKIEGSVKDARDTYTGLRRDITKLFNTARLSKMGTIAHQIIAGNAAHTDLEIKRLTFVLGQYAKEVGDIKGADSQAFCRLYQSGNTDRITNPAFRAFADTFREIERDQYAAMKELKIEPKELDWYFDQLWVKDEKYNEVMSNMLQSMGGPTYFMKERTVPSIPEGIAMGLTPKYDNLVDMAVAGRAAHQRYIGAQKNLLELESRQWSQTVKSRTEAPEGWEKFPGPWGDVYSRVERAAGIQIPQAALDNAEPMGGGAGRHGYEEVPGLSGYMKVGERYGPADVVAQFENLINRGLDKNSLYQVWQGSINAARHFQMFGSAFHVAAETINSVSNAAGMGLTDAMAGLFTGDIGRAATGMKNLLTSPAAMVQDVRGGLRMQKALMNPDWARVNDPMALEIGMHLTNGGMRTEAENRLSKILAGHFQQAWKDYGDLHLFKGTGELFRGFSSAIMEYIVPFSKNGAAMRQYLHEVARWERENPGETMNNEQQRAIAYEVREHSDDTFGNIARDNVSMNAGIRSLLSAVIQFPTWNIGTVKLFARAGIGGKDILMKAADFMTGKEVRQLDMKDKLAVEHVAGLLFVVGMMGMLTNKAMTGEDPKNLEDYFFPRTGAIKANGSAERIQFPTYLKDSMGLTHHPLETVGAKLSAPLHIITDLIKNKDYWGAQIYDPNDWAGQKMWDATTYVGKAAAPFSLSSYQQTESKTPGMAVLNALGARPVSRQYTNTPAQAKMDEIAQLKRGTSSKAEADKGKVKSDLYHLARTGDAAGFNQGLREAVDSGQLSGDEAKQMVKNAGLHPMVIHLKSLSLEQALGVWDLANDREKEIMGEALVNKIAKASSEKRNDLSDQLFPVLKELRSARKLRGAADAALVKIQEARAQEKMNRGFGGQKKIPLFRGNNAVE